MSVLQFLIAVDQLANTLIGGYADETLSARAYRLEPTSFAWSRFRKFVDTLFFWQPNHCQKAHDIEVQRRQLPPGYR